MLTFSILIKDMQPAIISHAHHEGSYIDLPREGKWPSHGDPLLWTIVALHHPHPRRGLG